MTEYIAYTDGSNSTDIAIAWGFVILKNNKIVHEDCGEAPVKRFKKHRNIYGEIVAVIQTIKWCKQNDIKEITIIYDYSGLEEWATGRWKKKTLMTKLYYESVITSGIHIKWIKVKGHSGDIWNDYADSLAKKGLRVALKRM